MTPRENLFQALRHGNPEWIPACVHIANANNLPGFLPKHLLSEPLDRLAISEFVGGDILYEISAIRCIMGGNIRNESITEGNTARHTITTPLGALTQVTQVCRNPTPQYDNLSPDYALPGPILTSTHTEYHLKSPEDYKIIRSYFEAQRFEADYGYVNRELDRVRDKGVLILGGGPPSPLYALIQSYAGIERFSFDLLDAPAEVERTMSVMRETACRWYAEAAKTKCDAIRCTEDLDTKLISPEMFRQYAAPALREYTRICHEHGKLFVLHMCGHIRELLPDIRETGTDVLHCLTPPPTGNTPISFAKEALEPRTAAMIRFDPHVLLNGNEKDISKTVSGMLHEADGWRGFLVIIPCGRASLWNVRQALEQIHRQGRWI